MSIDSISLFQSCFKLTLPDSKEPVNGLLPLIGEREEDLLPVVNHPLYSILMNFVTTRNLDDTIDYSYLALLGNTALHLILQPPNELREIMLKRVLMSTLLVYGRNEHFIKYGEIIKNSTELAIKYCT